MEGVFHEVRTATAVRGARRSVTFVVAWEGSERTVPLKPLRRRAVLLVLLMAVGVVLAGGVAGAIINGKPDANRHPYVGALVTDLDGKNLPICTGTLISPRVFLTAGHCTDYIKDEGLPTYVSFDPTFDQSSTLVRGRSYVFPRYREVPGNGLPEFDAYDVGVVVLKRPVSTAKGYGRLPKAGLVERLETGKVLTAVGYGASGFDVGGGQPHPVYRDVRYRANVRLINTENRVADMFVKLSGASAGRGGEGTCFGDSGGPIFLPNQRTVVANNSFVTNSRCAGVTYAQRMDLPPVLHWVRSFPRTS